MRLKVIYTGDPSETKIVNAETGEHLMGISSAEISIGPYQGYFLIRVFKLLIGLILLSLEVF